MPLSAERLRWRLDWRGPACVRVETSFSGYKALSSETPVATASCTVAQTVELLHLASLGAYARLCTGNRRVTRHFKSGWWLRGSYPIQELQSSGRFLLETNS